MKNFSSIGLFAEEFRRIAPDSITKFHLRLFSTDHVSVNRGDDVNFRQTFLGPKNIFLL